LILLVTAFIVVGIICLAAWCCMLVPQVALIAFVVVFGYLIYRWW
jgi:hypothetical protein